MPKQVSAKPKRTLSPGTALPPDACRVRIETRLPATVEVNASFELTCTIENLGPSALASAPPHPVHISYKWLDRQTGFRIDGHEGLRTALPRALEPARSEPYPVTIQAPANAGEFVLSLTLVQEQVAWFDDLDERNACQRLVRVVRSEGRSG